MILGALVDYYEILAKTGEVPKPGYSMAKVSHALNLNADGTLLGVIPLKQTIQRGKKTVEVSQLLKVPEQKKKSVNIAANFLCGTSSYVLGIDQKGKPTRTKKCFEAFKELHYQILNDADSDYAKAVLHFLNTWLPESAHQCAAIQNELEELMAGGNIVFTVSGSFVHEDNAVLREWDKHYASKKNDNVMQCLVTGQQSPIARLHPSIKGAGGQSSGVSVVSFNARAYESYGRDGQQGLNAPVSEYAAFAYTTALNHLLSDPKYRQVVGDTTIVYWAQSTNSIYRQLFNFGLNPVPTEESASNEMHADQNTQSMLSDLFRKLAQGTPISDVRGVIDPETRFFILGLAPNAARLSIRFFLNDNFGSIMDNLFTHYAALEIEHAPKDYEYLPLWRLMQETVSPNSRDKAASPLLAGAVLRSIFAGLPYPVALFQSVMRRIRAEQDISRGKAAIIKAYLIRNHNEILKEAITVSLNENSNNKAYVLGRLFSVLEKAQLDANPGINATIKDRYFTSACATPGSVFPTLLRLANHHTSKSEYGYVSERRITELMEKLEVDNNPYPAHQSLTDQGLFVLGYYHQSKANYAKKTKEEK